MKSAIVYLNKKITVALFIIYYIHIHYEVGSRSIETEAAFTKTEMNNQ